MAEAEAEAAMATAAALVAAAVDAATARRMPQPMSSSLEVADQALCDQEHYDAWGEDNNVGCSVAAAERRARLSAAGALMLGAGVV